MYRTPRLLILVLGLAVMLPFSAHAEPWYEIEVIIFENLAAGRAGETWPEQGAPAATPGTMELRPADPGSSGSLQAYQMLGRGELELADVAARLSNSKQYRVLRHFGWQQPLQERERATAVLVPDAGGRGRVLGTITPSLSRYLHLAADVILPGGPDGTGASQTRGFRLTESRRIRASELQYFDHPRFGVIAVLRSASPRSDSKPPAPAKAR